MANSIAIAMSNAVEANSVNSVNSEIAIDAPHGLKKDGTPAAKRGRKPGSTTGIPATRLSAVVGTMPSPNSVDLYKVPRSDISVPLALVRDYLVRTQTALETLHNMGQLSDDVVRLMVSGTIGTEEFRNSPELAKSKFYTIAASMQGWDDETLDAYETALVAERARRAK